MVFVERTSTSTMKKSVRIIKYGNIATVDIQKKKKTNFYNLHSSTCIYTTKQESLISSLTVNVLETKYDKLVYFSKYTYHLCLGKTWLKPWYIKSSDLNIIFCCKRKYYNVTCVKCGVICNGQLPMRVTLECQGKSQS